MPCGGIYPCGLSSYPCWHCGKSSPPADHILVEWDSVLHGACVKPFLETEEGKVVLEHKHYIGVKIDGMDVVVMQEEG